jgi:5-(aminomethyl)-3-furanmethanol phosphate kinase
MTETSVAAQMFAGPALVPFGVHTVVKFGGSLLADVGHAARVGAQLVAVHRRCPLAVFPGGGPTDKLIESMARQSGLVDLQINPACMRALDQTGILLAALTPGAVAVDNLAGVRVALRDGNLPVLLPSALILSLDVFTRHDVITSDTLGAYFAFLLGAARYVVLTDVDGVYRGFEPGRAQELLAECTAEELAELGATSVDRCLAPFLRATRLPAWVLNGRYPERLGELVDGGTPVGTAIGPGT